VTLWHGEDDADVPIGVGRAIARRLPKVRIVEVPGEGHSLLWHRADEILADIASQTA
jgi:pimeloyl-ACP methyl ester carboxylesterase